MLEWFFSFNLPTVKMIKKQIKMSSSGILKSIAKREFYLRKFSNTKSPEAKANFHNLFKYYRNMIVGLCRRSKKNHFNRYFLIVTLMTKIWKRVRNLISLKSKKSSPRISLNIGNTTAFDLLTVANTFNEFFTTLLIQSDPKYPKLLNTSLLT